MSTKKLNNQLEQMKGKTFQYGNQIHCVMDYTADDEKFTIKTNVNVYSRKLEAADEFLKYWTPASATNLPVIDEERQMAVFIEQETSQADKLIAILEDNIVKVQNDSGYIPQAQAINNNINSIINIQKMKLDVVKEMRRK